MPIGVYLRTKETKKGMSKARKGRNNPFYGKKHTRKTRKKMSQAMAKRIGENAPNWKGGITLLAEKIRHSFQYRQWRSDIFTRDNFTCVLCDKRGKGRLEADHYPKQFAELLLEYKIKTLTDALRCEELWNINNGRTLCKKCHEKTSNYGKGYLKDKGRS